MKPKPSRRLIIKEVLREHNIKAEEFFDSEHCRSRKMTSIRRQAICRLYEGGARINEIARSMKLNHGTIRYHLLSSEKRIEKKSYYRKRWREMRESEPENYQVELIKRRTTNRAYKARLRERRKADLITI